MLNEILKLIIINIFLIFFLKKISFKLSLLDIPNSRKKHSKPTPYTGGILISLSFLFLILSDNLNNNFQYDILICCIIISITGFFDDKIKLTPGVKILFQIFPIILILMNDLILTNIGEYKYFKLNFGKYSIIFSLLCYLLIINAKNYIDGIDGLAASLVLNSLLLLIIFLNIYNITNNNTFIMLISIPILIFLILNLKSNSFKFFLGDSGSNLLGLLLGSLCVYLFKTENIHPALIIWSITVIIFDFLSTCLFRIFAKKNNLFKAGNDHIHYELGKLKKINNNTIKINIILNLLNLMIGSIGLLIFLKLGPDISLLCYVLAFILYYFFRLMLRNHLK